MTDAGLCQKRDSIIFFLQEAEFPRRTSTGFHMCDGESISGIEIIEILRISCNVGSCHRILPYSPGKLTRFLYLKRIGGFSMEYGFQIMRFCLYIESNPGTCLFRRKRPPVFRYHFAHLPIALAILIDLNKLQRPTAGLVRKICKVTLISLDCSKPRNHFIRPAFT